MNLIILQPGDRTILGAEPGAWSGANVLDSAWIDEIHQRGPCIMHRTGE